MQDEDKIFGLIAQAEDMQKQAIAMQNHAIALQHSCKYTIENITEVCRKSIVDVSRDVITKETQNSSDKLIEAVNNAKNAASILKSTGLRLGFLLFAISIIFGTIGFCIMYFISESKLKELAEIKATINQEKRVLNSLKEKTWGLQLEENKQGRFIILPQGTKIDTNGLWKVGKNEAIRLIN